MSFFGKLFGKGSDKDPVTTGEAIQKLRETEEMLMKKQVILTFQLIFSCHAFTIFFKGFLGKEN